jgi:hypothetical protein
MNNTVAVGNDRCIVPGVQPLLVELHEPVKLYVRGQQDAGRDTLERFVQHVYRNSFGADLGAFYPHLTAFITRDRIRGVVGYRDGMEQPLFSELYLDAPVERVMASYLDEAVERRRVVEVGNLALAGAGEARWAIAAMTVLLYAAGYRWVLFTAIRSLFNAFQRLGLNPVQIAIPEPGRLPDNGSSWGSYYDAGPRVYAGNIEAGLSKLRAHVSPRQPRVHALLQDAQRLGTNIGRDGLPGIREAV